MAGTVLAGLSISNLVGGRLGPTPVALGYLALGVSIGALVTISVSALVSWWVGLELWFNSVEVDDKSVTLEGSAQRTVRFQDIQSVVAFAGTTWLVLRNGDLIELLFYRDVEATYAEALFPAQLRASPLEVVPTPAALGRFSIAVLLDPMVLVLGAGFFVAVAEGLLGLPLGAGFGAFSAAMATMAFWRRGSRLVVAKDGIRVGKRFYSLDDLTSFACTDRRVTWTHAGKQRRAKVRVPKSLALALERRVRALIEGDAPKDDAMERREGEDVHAWLGRVTALFHGGDFREPALSKERVLAAAHGKGPLRVRVAVLAALKDDAPELVEAIARESADPRFVRVLEAAGDDDAWRKVVDDLEKKGQLEAER